MYLLSVGPRPYTTRPDGHDAGGGILEQAGQINVRHLDSYAGGQGERQPRQTHCGAQVRSQQHSWGGTEAGKNSAGEGGMCWVSLSQVGGGLGQRLGRDRRRGG